MTSKQKEWLTDPRSILAAITLIVLVLSSLGFVRKSEVDEMRSQRDAQIATMKAQRDAQLAEMEREHKAEMTTVERKLDCALWGVPNNCRNTMAPHEVGQ